MNLQTARPNQIIHPVGENILGSLAFASLRAEEEPWLRECFVPPPNFGRIADPNRSVVLFGDPGSGKTAVYKALETYSLGQGGKPVCLLVHWRPSPLAPHAQPNLTWVKRLTEELLDACAAALICYMERFPQDYMNAPLWAQSRLIWFTRRFTMGSPELRWGPIAEGPEPGASLIRQILAAPVPEVLYEDAPPESVIAELLSALRATGLSGIWVLTDGLETWTDMAADQLTGSLKAFLSTLSLLGQSGLIYKLCLPAEIESAMSLAGGIARRRVDSIHLRWDSSTLRQLVERRLAFAFGQESFPLEKLCNAPGLLQWLEKAGGESPREWLDQVAALVEHYAMNPQSAPIDEKTWMRLRLNRPPRLYLDEKRGRIIVGGRQINLEKLPTKAYEMLRYLYGRGGEIVTWAELYYKVYRGLDYVPPPMDDAYEPPANYKSILDTNLWRLRRAVEPDPNNCVLLLTRRGHGVTLQVRW